MPIRLLRRWTLTAGTSALFALAVLSCKKEPPPAPAAVEPPPPPPAAPLSVQSVDLGKAVGADKHIATPTTTFGPRDTIYASVATSGAAPSATLGARWTFEKTGQLVDSTSVPIAPTGPAVTEFHVMRTSAWPTGKYKVAILLNGQSMSEKEFEIKR